jgi:ABC-2 type transport system permease protein
MTPALAILRRELSGYLWSPLGWTVMAMFLLVQGYSFYLLVALAGQPQAPHDSVLRLFFGGTLLYWVFFIVVVSVITMRLLADERRSGTLESLLTAPVSELSVVIGKFSAAMAFFLLLWLPTGVYVYLVWQIRVAPPLDPGPIVAGYLGVVVIGAACLAIGTMCSALFSSQIVAALATFTFLMLLLLLEPLGQLLDSPWARSLSDYLGLFAHMDDFSRGIVDTRRLMMHTSVVLFALTVAVKALERIRR